MKDRTGRTLEVGQTVDILVQGMCTAYVMDVRDAALVGPTGETAERHLLLSVAVPVRVAANGVAPVYIVRQVEKENDIKKEIEKVVM